MIKINKKVASTWTDTVGRYLFINNNMHKLNDENHPCWNPEDSKNET
jgi:hypothetical protein